MILRYLTAFVILAASALSHAAETASFRPDREEIWQFSVPVPTMPDRRAYLWVPPDCKQVRGVVIALQNMLEKPLFERPAFRKALAQNQLAAVLIFPGHDAENGDNEQNPRPERSPLDLFLTPHFQFGKSRESDEDPTAAGEEMQRVLNALASESGYTEIKDAPLLPVGHSSAGSFVWHIYRWNPSRIFAMMPFKTGIKTDGPQGIPIFNVESEWFDYGKASNNVSSKPSDIARQLQARGNGDASLFGMYTDIGAGHCNVSDDSIRPVAMFLRKAMLARIPAGAPTSGPITLKTISPESGWLLDPNLYGKPEGRATAYADWKGDLKKGLWYLDRELAEAVQKHAVDQLAKKPQQLNFKKNDGTVPTVGGGFPLDPKFIDDAGTFKVEAAFIDHMTQTDLFSPETVLGHSSSPILYRVNSGALIQVGPDTFRVRPHFGPHIPQGNPWEPVLVAYHAGDAEYRPTERPANVRLNVTLKDGQPQTLTFPAIPDQSASRLSPIKLDAVSSSGLPVQYYMVSGPASIEDGRLVFDKIPIRSKYPIKVTVAAWQWGRPVDPKIQTAPVVTREFLINK